MDADPVLDPDEELAAEREYDSLVASAAEARAIEEAEAELRTQDAATLPEGVEPHLHAAARRTPIAWPYRGLAGREWRPVV